MEQGLDAARRDLKTLHDAAMAAQKKKSDAAAQEKSKKEEEVGGRGVVHVR